MSDLEMLSPQNCAIALIDFQPAMYQGVQSHDRLTTLNNVEVLAKAAKLFGIPTVLSTVEAKDFAGPFMPEITELSSSSAGNASVPSDNAITGTVPIFIR